MSGEKFSIWGSIPEDSNVLAMNRGEDNVFHETLPRVLLGSEVYRLNCNVPKEKNKQVNCFASRIRETKYLPREINTRNNNT